MQASCTKLQNIIEGTKQYLVPLFQRHYEWSREQWETLWQDIVELYEQDAPRLHFMGSIVTMPAKSVPEGIPKFSIIDGQQRLTTLFILLTLLRDKARAGQDADAELAEEIDHTLLVNPYKKGLERFKILPAQVDRPAFEKLVAGQWHGDYAQVGDSASSKICQAYAFFDKKYTQSQLTIERLKTIITAHLGVVSIVLEESEDPYLVFESLNAKGQKLTQADLIRNYLFMLIHVDEQEAVYREHWQPLEAALGENLTEFIRHYLMRDGRIIEQKRIYCQLKENVTATNILPYIQELNTFGHYYRKFLSPQEYEPQIVIQKYLHRLQRLEVTTAFPLLLSCYHDYQQQRLTQAELVVIFQTIENFIIRRFVCNMPTRALAKIFTPLDAEIRKKFPGRFVAGIKQLLQTKGYPRDIEFRARLKDQRIYGKGKGSEHVKLILESIEAAYAHKEPVTFDKLTIEHIMPQNLSDDWKHELGPEWQATHELWLDTLGNLTLTAYNSELSNHEFAAKRAFLLQSHLELNRDFARYQTWQRTEIEARAASLGDKVLAIWPYFGDASCLEETVTGTSPVLLTVLGKQVMVKTWRDVLEHTIDAIAEAAPEQLAAILEEFPHVVGEHEHRFRTARKTQGGLFIETNLGARGICQYCQRIVEFAGFDDGEWQVKTV